MLVKRQEKDNKIKAMYSSSTICASVFDNTTKDLIVIFNNGGQYKYPNVSLTDYTRLEISESTGTDFKTHIKKKYTNFEKLDNISDAALAAIKKDVNELSEADTKIQLESKTKEMFKEMTALLGEYVSTGKVSKDGFEKLQTKITAYDNIINPASLQKATA